MDTTSTGWTIIDRDAGVLFRSYTFNDAGGSATTWVARIGDGKLLAISPGKGFSDADHQDLAEFGEVVAVVAPNGFHHLGVAEWRTRYPNARFFAPKLAQARIAKKNPDAGTFEDLSELKALLPGNVSVREAPATKVGELWAWAKTADGYAWYASDLICNWESFPGPFFLNWIWKWTKSGPGYKLFHFAMMAIVKDKKALFREWLEDLKAHPPTHVVPAHGPCASHEGVGQQTIDMVAAAL